MINKHRYSDIYYITNCTVVNNMRDIYLILREISSTASSKLWISSSSNRKGEDRRCPHGLSHLQLFIEQIHCYKHKLVISFISSLYRILANTTPLVGDWLVLHRSTDSPDNGLFDAHLYIPRII